MIGVIGVIKSEIRKVTSTRMWWAMMLGVIVWAAFQAGISAAFAGSDSTGGPAIPNFDDPATYRNVYATATYAGAYIFAMILGITAMTGEKRYQTLTPTFLAQPRRQVVVVAKALAHILFGFIYASVAALSAIAVGASVIALRGHSVGLDSQGLWPAMAGAVVAVMLWTLIGIGIGTLIPNQVVAILVAILFTFLIEPLASLAMRQLDALQSALKFLPGNASSAMTSPGGSYFELLSAWQGGLVLLCYALVFGLLGVWLTTGRDVT